MRKNFNLKQKGFTMVELLLYMGIFSILLLVFTQIFTSILDVHLESQATSAVSQDGTYIMARLTHDIREASSITTPSTYGGSGTNTLHIATPNDYSYALSGQNLSVNGTYQLNSADTKVTSINFTKLGTAGKYDSILITFTLESVAIRRGNRPEIKTFTTTVEERQ